MKWGNISMVVGVGVGVICILRSIYSVIGGGAVTAFCVGRSVLHPPGKTSTGESLFCTLQIQMSIYIKVHVTVARSTLMLKNVRFIVLFFNARR